MAKLQHVIAAQDRLRRIYEKRPESAQSQMSCRVVLRDGLRCELVDSPWSLAFDQPKTMGGNESAPTPGVVGRAAVAACLVQGYAITFAEQDIDISRLEVELTGAGDDRGFISGGEFPAHYKSLRVRVMVESSSPRDAVEEALALTEKRSPWYNNMAREIPMTRDLELTAT